MPPKTPTIATTQAQRIIKKFKNPRRLAQALTTAGLPINPSSVYRWQYERPRGMGGVIPNRVMPYLNKAARLEGIVLNNSDLYPGLVSIKHDEF